MLQYVDFLRKVPLFSELAEAELRQLAGVVREQHYRKNVTICHINDPGNALFILKNGLVKITIEDSNGREVILRILYPPDHFGEMALIESLPRSATVTTQDPTDALVIYRDHFLLLIEKSPKILLNVAATLSRRLRRMNELIRSLAFYDVYGKVARVLLELATERGRQTEKGTVIDLRFTQQELAELAGMSRETMTRTLRDFQQAGVVRIESGIITILEIDMLRREVDMA
jgi:CRP/FNR family cyclic AMP-dependent transcriptional regulator